MQSLSAFLKSIQTFFFFPLLQLLCSQIPPIFFKCFKNFSLKIYLYVYIFIYKIDIITQTYAQIHISTQSLGKVWEEALVKESNLG